MHQFSYAIFTKDRNLFRLNLEQGEHDEKEKDFCRLFSSDVDDIAPAITTLSQSAEEEVEGFVDLMAALQYFSHKVGLSIRGENLELADFYMHEIEETLAAISEVESYDGHPVGELSKMMGPVVEDVGGGLDAGDPQAAMDAYQRMIDTCNTCHAVTNFGYIKIVDRSTENPFMQAFD